MVDGAQGITGGGGRVVKVLEFPRDKMEEVRQQWENRSVLVRSLGWLMPSEWIAKDFKIRGKLKTDLGAFLLAKDHHLIRFQSEDECGVIL